MSPHKSKRFTGPLNQTAVYWANPTSTGMMDKTFTGGVEIDCRWEDKADTFTDPTGEEATSTAVVVVAQDLDLGGYLYLGELTDLSSSEAADPLEVDDAKVIRGVEKVPIRDASDFFRRVFL